MSKRSDAIAAVAAEDITVAGKTPCPANQNLRIKSLGGEQESQGPGAGLPPQVRVNTIDEARGELGDLVRGFVLHQVPRYWERREEGLALRKNSPVARQPMRSELLAKIPVDRRESKETLREAYELMKELVAAGAPIATLEGPLEPPCMVGKIAVGVGKSTTACDVIGDYVKEMEKLGRPASVAYFVPRHDLAEELANKFTERTGISAKIWRGTDVEDPNAPGSKMCREPELSKAAVKARVALKEVCAVCLSHHLCGYRQQGKPGSEVWFLPHQMLFMPRPKDIEEPTLVVLDEGFWQVGLSGFDADIDLAVSTLDNIPTTLCETDQELVSGWRGQLKTALDGTQGDGRLTRQMLQVAGLNAGSARDAHLIEWHAKPKFNAKAHGGDLVAALEHHATLFNRRVPRLWRLVTNCLASPDPYVIGLHLKRQVPLSNGKGYVDMLALKWKRDIADSWSGRPTLILDATAREELIRPYFPNVTYARTIDVDMPYQKVIQVADRSFSKSMFIGGSKKPAPKPSTPENNIARLRLLIQLKASEHRGKGGTGGDVLVISQKDVEKALRAGSLPARVALRHFNDVAGLDIYRDVACVLVVGQTLPNASDLEDMTEVLTGRPVKSSGSSEWERQEAVIRTRTGQTVNVQIPRHSDLVTEAVRWNIAEGNIIQAIGRARGVNRSAADPVEIVLLTKLPVPVAVDEIMTWHDTRVNRFQEAFMRGRGNIPTSDSELYRAFGSKGRSGAALWPSENAVKLDRKAHGDKGVISLLGSLIEKSPPYRATYRRAGQRGRWSPALVASNDPVEAKAALETIVGVVEGFALVDEESAAICQETRPQDGDDDVNDAA